MRPENKNKNRYEYSCRSFLRLALGCFILALLLGLGQVQKEREALAGRLAPSILRFHILANSDGKEDQQVKLEVRSLILDYIRKLLPDDAGKAGTAACLLKNRDAIEHCADRYLSENGFDYQASLQVTQCYFPTRVYDRIVFPCGTYDAVRITLGKGKGHNWWCVLYPRFCFVDAACSETPEESLALLRQNLNQDDYLALEDHRPEIRICFRLFPGISFTPAHSGLPPAPAVPQPDQ